MKHLLCLILLFCLLLSGCSGYSAANDSVSFYYVRTEYREDMTTLIAPEKRDAAGHTSDLSYLLALYLIGPSTEELTSPIPRDTELLSVSQQDDAIAIRLSDTEKTMTDPQFALSCACLSMTCLDLTDAQTITITSGTRSITMTRDNFALIDTLTEETQ